MRRDDWLIVDTETTGLGESGEVIGGGVYPAGAQVFAVPVRPQAAIRPDTSAVHGQTMGDLADAPGFPKIWPQPRAVLHGHTLIAHDAKFDRRMLEQTLWRYGLTPPPLPHRYRPRRLTIACQRLGIPLDKFRTADRCRATQALLRAMAGCEGEQLR